MTPILVGFVVLLLLGAAVLADVRVGPLDRFLAWLEEHLR